MVIMTEHVNLLLARGDRGPRAVFLFFFIIAHFVFIFRFELTHLLDSWVHLKNRTIEIV